MIRSIAVVLMSFFGVMGSVCAENRTITYKDSDNNMTHKVVLDCEFYGALTAQCNKQEIVFSDGATYFPKLVPKDKSGLYEFSISGLGYIATTNQDIYYTVDYLDKNGGNPRVEGYEILECAEKKPCKSKYGLMNYKQYQSVLKSLKVQHKVDFKGGPY